MAPFSHVIIPSAFKVVIDQHSDDFSKLCEDGPKFIQDESDLQQQSLRQQLDDIIAGWRELDVLWMRRRNLLEESMNYQVLRLHESYRCLYHTNDKVHQTIPKVTHVLFVIYTMYMNI